MKKIEGQIVLGPLLGVESDKIYSVCVLTELLDTDPVLKINGKSVLSEYSETVLEKYSYYRFSFILDSYSETNSYIISYKSDKLSNIHSVCEWNFRVCMENEIPKISFVSCNGQHNISFNRIEFDNDYSGWQELNLYQPDLLILTGDQVYADSIIDEVSGLNELLIRGGKLGANVIKKIDELYLELYIRSWKSEAISYALATIPNIMVWDDHDIIDGYGSYSSAIQERLEPVYQIARKYYVLFQLRGKTNSISRTFSGRDINQFLHYRNYKIVLPDTRSNRSKINVFDKKQLAGLEAWIIKSRYIKKCTLIFVIPVPLAHLDYIGPIELLISFFDRKWSKHNFIKHNSDDLIDHWDHELHKCEQKKVVDFFFEAGDKLRVKHLVIVSGDVHSAGASTLKNFGGPKRLYATQLITSPIVNKPAPWYLFMISRKDKLIGDIGCALLNFGNSRRRLFRKRNFMILGGNPLKAHLIYETSRGIWPKSNLFRTINKFEDSKLSKRAEYYLKRLEHKRSRKRN